MFEDKEVEVSASAKRVRISPPLDSQDIHGSSVGGAALPEDTALEQPRVRTIVIDWNTRADA